MATSIFAAVQLLRYIAARNIGGDIPIDIPTNQNIGGDTSPASPAGLTPMCGKIFWKFRVLEPHLSKLVGRVEPFQCPLSYFSHYTSINVSMFRLTKCTYVLYVSVDFAYLYSYT